MPGNCHLCNKPDAKSCCGGCKSVFYCDRQCQIKHWNDHKLECKKFKSQSNTTDSKQEEKKPETLDMNNFTFTLPIFDDTSIHIKQTNDYGYGMFANCNFKKGAIICKEKALMVLPDYAKQKMTFYIKQQYLLLSETQKNIYKSLSRKDNNIYDDERMLLNIFVNNQIIITQRKSCCIFPILSRINHNCIGNAHWIWNEKNNEQRLIALCDIDKNNEILVNYCGIDPIESKQRKIELKTKWNIECKCNWCLNDKINHKMDEIINEYNKLDVSLEKLVSNPLNGYKTSQKLIKMVEKQFNSNPNLMHKHCYDCAQFALGLQKWGEASYYLEQSMKEKQMAEGNDIEISDLFMEKVKLLPTKFRSRFRKFDPKYKMRMQKKSKNDKLKQVSNDNKQKQSKSGTTKNGKKSNVKSNGKKKSGRNNKSKNNKNKGKKTRK